MSVMRTALGDIVVISRGGKDICSLMVKWGSKVLPVVVQSNEIYTG